VTVTAVPRISAVICTHNREDYLRLALESLTAQTLPADAFEVVVVDNASTDRTPDVVREFVGRVPNLRYVREARLGLSVARNTGYVEARAPYVAYLDDDARAEPGWLAGLLRVFETDPGKPACIGGRVWMDWGSGVPAWLPPRFYPVYTFVDYGAADRPLAGHEYVVGANLSFRRDVLAELNGFDPNLGRKGTSLQSGEESAIVGRIRRRGWPVYYAGSAAVWHAVAPERRRRRWLLSRMFWDGAAQPIIDSGTGRPRSHYLRQGTYDLRRIARFALDLVLGVGGDRFRRTEHSLAIVQRVGRLRTHLLLAAGRIR
jgi:glycosyltransferase involved in cell wall biosynthesis